MGGEGVGTSPFSLTPTLWDTFLSLLKPHPGLNPRWRSLHQNALARDLARQNTPALQAKESEDSLTVTSISATATTRLLLIWIRGL